jgi:hypothetical protein
MDAATYARIPATLEVREIKARGHVIVSTLTEAKHASKAELAELYTGRWSVDLDFLKELDEFKKTHKDLTKYGALMYGISQEPGNGELSIQELYDIAKKIIDG